MAEIKQIQVPDIGNFKDVNVIEVLVKAGDTVKAEDALITLETDKATMDVPAPFAGVVKEMKVKAGNKVSQGAVILLLESGDTGGVPAIQPAATVATSVAASPVPAAQTANPSRPPLVRGGGVAPSPDGTTSHSTRLPKDDSQVAGYTPPFAKEGAVTASATPLSVQTTPALAIKTTASDASATPPFAKGGMGGISAHASPAIRRFARELGVDLTRVQGGGAKGRVTKDDVQSFVKAALAQSRSTGGLQVAAMPEIDFSQFGPIETRPLARIRKISGANLHRNWVSIPHVTQFDEADITEMEAFRKQLNEEYAGQSIKITPLAFLLKAVVEALQQFPEFNASLDASGENLVLKKYFHIGVAVDTPDGLMVPVLRDVRCKGIVQLAKELAEASARARDGKLTATDMQGGCFTISSLGGIGGTAFTPIVNAPEVAILGVSRAAMRQVYKDGAFAPRLMLPLSLSYDHRVIDGASAVRFIVYLAQTLADIRRLAL
ncbi:MAG: branched-chain alpha-keto acid dehydrogenase subunit E2 [Gallionellales bacterium RIFCSPLOWO2_12_FULL_59_22]|nr:MAG: branched-chain alpha-keto acid dehydrogenase subunit E2 [Gallionellales bacterium RIFCSPLOWO2_02_FULL_59_110]OGT03990.1 MAG: branched-chain alpha-keto acid dehydrogenase subunit E2 [Gallionellales bacterium RIFCSPLOWO2_02_58_13]OGT13963.1 MAG: branched-chain alpha-keto acid dehydrogenase subunit E2 [Gallionellales bacterium RIFCSPLOWO2_12_FULL_59_22]